MTRVIDGLVPSYDQRKAGQRGSRLPQRGRRPAAVATLVALGLVGLLTAVTRMGTSRWADVAAAEVVSGHTIQIARGERWSRLLPGEKVPEGAQVQTGATEARLRLDNGEVWLAPETAAQVFSDQVEMSRGEILVASSGKVRAQWQDVAVVGEGIFRVAGGTHPRIGVYQGRAEVTRPGETRALAALDQLQLATRRLPADPDPLSYSPADPWDTQLLGQAIAFDTEVARVASSIDLRFSERPRSEDFYRQFTAVDDVLLPTLLKAAPDVSSEGQFGPPSEVLITMFAARATARAWGQPVNTSLERIVQWRAQGARWGLVSLRAKITVADFTRALDLSQVVAPIPVAKPAARQVAAQVPVLDSTVQDSTVQDSTVQDSTTDTPAPAPPVPTQPEPIAALTAEAAEPSFEESEPQSELEEPKEPEIPELPDETLSSPDPVIELPDLRSGEVEESMRDLLDLLGEALTPREML
jgi:hypothetical protein